MAKDVCTLFSAFMCCSCKKQGWVEQKHPGEGCLLFASAAAQEEKVAGTARHEKEKRSTQRGRAVRWGLAVSTDTDRLLEGEGRRQKRFGSDEGKNSTPWTRADCSDFAASQKIFELGS